MAGMPGKSLEKVGDQLQKFVTHVVKDGVGKVAGSESYALGRLSRAGRRSSTDESAPASDSLDADLAPEDDQPDDDRHKDAEAAINRIILESVGASATQGFVTGLGGLVTLPLTLPANVAGSLILNARMVGAIAYLRGYDLDDPHTHAMIMLTVAGSSAQAVLSELGVTVGKQAAKKAIAAVPVKVIHKINQKAGFHLVAKYGTKRAAVTLAKAVPGIGGLVGGGVDAAATRAIGQAAKKVFPR
jgi:hypothetical protein